MPRVEDQELGGGEKKGGDKLKKAEKRKTGRQASLKAVLDGDPAGFVIGPRMMLELLQG